jgi:hypothetical protein
MPFDLHYTAARHEATIQRIEAEVNRFDEEVHALVRKYSNGRKA